MRVHKELDIYNNPRMGFVDYGFGYRDRYPEGWVNPSIYTAEMEDALQKTGGWLPLRSEIDYQDRRRKRMLHKGRKGE